MTSLICDAVARFLAKKRLADNQAECSFCFKRIERDHIRGHEGTCSYNPRREEQIVACSYCGEVLRRGSSALVVFVGEVHEHIDACDLNPKRSGQSAECPLCGEALRPSRGSLTPAMFSVECAEHEELCRIKMGIAGELDLETISETRPLHRDPFIWKWRCIADSHSSHRRWRTGVPPDTPGGVGNRTHRLGGSIAPDQSLRADGSRPMQRIGGGGTQDQFVRSSASSGFRMSSEAFRATHRLGISTQERFLPSSDLSKFSASDALSSLSSHAGV
ncbi:unnamed protein product [Polarella glacialis]|uniref:Uncharacterized protein n=1 Tax=Polarella glacialis TaxID=89957 RepID=A0A813E3Z0_POLGL|nr:unnamed protein product [Polarella glacialis]